MTYYNTRNLSGNELKEAVRKAKNQEEAIRTIYLNTRKAYSPSDILGMMQRAGFDFPITSLRRAITNLQKKGDLIMLSEKKIGMYGSPEHLWIVNKSKHPLIESQQAKLFIA